jgi:hypothetical protein
LRRLVLAEFAFLVWWIAFDINSDQLYDYPD